ncbi:LysR family transcriptional regulator [Pigmentibacter sp. JX0631]|uniref:LysR family transcriptional regulator n=1 Tax=Pigmentibacter sp. JX0631 TaxID=2976982 RepID=UPI002469975F|nr:LysR family transcriptional regulator [Pigmentibacter sp. JX0631]WGL59813.1 LysR family transcriptional regulator [Pigmentibacter sp. JX0631]
MIASPADLLYFIEVSNVLNLSKAAKRAGVSQPSLTQAMKRLEESIGTSLLIRNKSGVMLTQAGKQLLAQSKFLIKSWEQLKVQALASINEIQGSYTIGCHPSVGLFTLSEFLPTLLLNHQKLEVNLFHSLSRKIVEGVISSNIDIGIAVNPFYHPDLIIHKICDDEVTFWSSNPAKDLHKLEKDECILLCDPDLIQVQSVLKNASKKGIKFKRIISSSSLEVIGSLVSQGCGIGILPTNVANLVEGRKLFKLENFPAFHDEICLLYRVENRNIKAIQAISKAIMNALKPKN